MDFTIVKDRRLVAFFFGLLPGVAMISKIDRTVVSIAGNFVEIMRTANMG